MSSPAKTLLLRVLRVPARPQPPAGETGQVLTFRASPYYFRYRLAVWALQQLVALAVLVGGALFFRYVVGDTPPLQRFTGWGVLELIAWIVFIVQLPITFMIVRLDFEMRWYLLADRSLRIREGILVMREKTMSYANIQNISIQRNPLQRVFGLATVEVRAAGGGSGGTEPGKGSGSDTHEAKFDGVDNADEIRQILRDRIRRHRDSGLGDPDDVHDTEDDHVDESPTLIAARNLLEEARALRAARAL